jgi:ferredoxin-NADP reductase
MWWLPALPTRSPGGCGHARVPFHVRRCGNHDRHASAPGISLTDTVAREGRRPLSGREFETDVRVARKHLVAQGVVALELHRLDGRALPPWQPGAHVDLVIEGVPVRQYSLSGNPREQHAWRLGILREAQSRGGSRYVHERLNAGDVARVRGPRNNFELLASERYLFIAGGIGITPILPMVRAAETAGAEWKLVYGGRHRNSMAFTGELSRYGDKVSLWPENEKGLIDLPGLLREPRPGTLVYCCGPGPLLDAVECGCAGWPRGSLHAERFSANPQPEGVIDTGFEVHLAQSNRTLYIPPERSILSVLTEDGVCVISNCGEGVCGTCETGVLDGVPDHRDSVLDDDERAAATCMMICVSRACSGSLTLDL